MYKKLIEGLYTDLMLKVATLKKAGVAESDVRIMMAARPCWWELQVLSDKMERAEAALGLLHLPDDGDVPKEGEAK
jgi:hypothetical protein